jgi:hypothetical protein
MRPAFSVVFAAAFSACRPGHIVALRRAGVELARATDLLRGSEIISFHCATQPTVRARANSTVNISVGKPIASRMMPE